MMDFRRATLDAAAIFAAALLAAPIRGAEPASEAPAKPATPSAQEKKPAPEVTTAKTGPMTAMSAAYAVDGMLLVNTGSDTPFTLMIANGERERTATRNNQILVIADDRPFQQTLLPLADFLDKPLPSGDAHAILSAHAAWAMKLQNELTNQKLQATVEFVKLGGTEWAYFKYDVAGYIKEQEAEGKLKPGESTAVNQHLATTIVGSNVLVLSAIELQGDTAEAARKALLDNAATLKRYDKALSREDIIAICKGEKK